MKKFITKTSLTGIGLMTGTSCDGVDISCVRFHENSSNKLELIAYNTMPYTTEISQFVQNLISHKIHISEISQFNFYLSQVYYNSINDFISSNNIDKSDIDFIAVHGQTIWHNPYLKDFLGKEVSSSFQAVNISALAKLMEIPVVGDFRAGDIALGGQGAPLVPVFDYNFLRNKEKDTICLNIGGISNITFMPKGNSKNKILAFDCGPGNTLIDLAAKYYFGVDFDKDGEIASSGKINKNLLKFLLDDDFLSSIPPKSTGREKYNLYFLNSALKKLPHSTEPKNILRTLTEFTAEAVSININKFTNPNSEIIVSGGGRNNPLLMNLLKEKLPQAKFSEIENYGIPSDGKESIAFAYLGWLFLKGLPGNIPSATGASKETILGCLAI